MRSWQHLLPDLRALRRSHPLSFALHQGGRAPSSGPVTEAGRVFPHTKAGNRGTVRLRQHYVGRVPASAIADEVAAMRRLGIGCNFQAISRTHGTLSLAIPGECHSAGARQLGYPGLPQRTGDYCSVATSGRVSWKSQA
jgi:hypothetical protein